MHAFPLPERVMNGWLIVMVLVALAFIVGPFATLKLMAKLEAMRARRRSERDGTPP